MSFATTGPACLPDSNAAPNSPRKSNFSTVSLIMFPFSSRLANRVPLNTFDRKTDRSLFPVLVFLNTGRAANSFARERIGPGIPVPPLRPAVLLEPATSLTK